MKNKERKAKLAGYEACKNSKPTKVSNPKVKKTGQAKVYLP